MALHVRGYRIGLDTRDSEANLNFVSHAHFDHTSGIRKDSEVICSHITKELVEARSGRKVKMVDIPSCATLLNSGHMLGSRQLYIESDDGGLSIAYTGDYMMQKSIASEPVEVREVDILLMDSTYPFANIAFDVREETVTAIERYLQYKGKIGCVVFGAYSAGKAQELVGICNEVGIDPIVDHKIARMTDVYNYNGFRLRYQEIEETAINFGSQAMIVSNSALDGVRALASANGKQIFTAVATGFAKMMRFGTDVQFALSDHADFGQALDYIGQASPKLIYTYGHNAETMAKNLRAHGQKAQPLNVKSRIAGKDLLLSESQ